MQSRIHRDIDRLAADLGADAWVLVRSNKHLIIEFMFTDITVRAVMASTPSDQRARHNCRAHVRRAVRAAA